MMYILLLRGTTTTMMCCEQIHRTRKNTVRATTRSSGASHSRTVIWVGRQRGWMFQHMMILCVGGRGRDDFVAVQK
jgi:hypothetical protein